MKLISKPISFTFISPLFKATRFFSAMYIALLLGLQSEAVVAAPTWDYTNIKVKILAHSGQGHIPVDAEVWVEVDQSDAISGIKFKWVDDDGKPQKFLMDKILFQRTKSTFGDIRLMEFVAFQTCEDPDLGYKHEMNGTFVQEGPGANFVALDYEYFDIGVDKCKEGGADHGRGGGNGWD